MSRISYITYIMISITILMQDANAFSFKKISSAFGGKPFQEVIEKEYPINNQQKIVIDNTHGDIVIKTAWNQPTIVLKATISCAKQEQETVHIIDDISNPKEFALRTITDDESNKSKVHYELIVPANIKLQLSTNKGNITIYDAHGITMATTQDGAIYLHNVHNKVCATTRNSGSIYSKECSGPLYATTKRGNITLSDIHNTVVAKTESGKIAVHCKDLPNDSQIDLSSIWGNIVISLPEESHANVKASTQKGTCVCDHYVTLRPQTTKLNNSAWTQFKRTVDGTIGNGTVPVQISSVGSNIRIVAHKTS